MLLVTSGAVYLFDLYNGDSTYQLMLRHYSPTGLQFVSSAKSVTSSVASVKSYTTYDWMSACLVTSASSWTVYHEGLVILSGSYSTALPLPLPGTLIFGKMVAGHKYLGKKGRAASQSFWLKTTGTL